MDKENQVSVLTHSFLFEIGAKLSAANRKGVGSVVNRKWIWENINYLI